MGIEHFLLREELIKLQIKFLILISLSKLRRKLKKQTQNSIKWLIRWPR
jgi:hypothetical protein